eukprot:EG_transcript_21378
MTPRHTASKDAEAQPGLESHARGDPHLKPRPGRKSPAMVRTSWVVALVRSSLRRFIQSACPFDISSPFLLRLRSTMHVYFGVALILFWQNFLAGSHPPLPGHYISRLFARCMVLKEV